MNPEVLLVITEGFFLGLALIMGIGPQNAFILQQGMKRQGVLLIALLASLIDGGLILFGAGGASGVFEGSPVLVKSISCLGIAFLLAYGWKSFRSALRPQALEFFKAIKQAKSMHTVVLATLAVSLLNPSTYLDTMFVIGGSAAQYHQSLRIFFAAGAIIASTCWFFMLAFGAAKLSRVL